MSVRLPISGYSFIFLMLFISLSSIGRGCGSKNKSIKKNYPYKSFDNITPTDPRFNNLNYATHVGKNISGQESIEKKSSEITQDYKKKSDSKIKKKCLADQEINHENYKWEWQGAGTLETMARAQAQAEQSNIKNQFSLQKIRGFIKSQGKKWTTKFIKPKIKKKIPEQSKGEKKVVTTESPKAGKKSWKEKFKPLMKSKRKKRLAKKINLSLFIKKKKQGKKSFDHYEKLN